jgi:hypothetical protein
LNRYLYISLLLGLLTPAVHSQGDERERYIQVSGIITDISNHPVQGVAIISRKLHSATVSEPSGIYSITSTPGDTIFYRALGYKRYHTIIPITYTESHANVDILLETDTIQIEAITILPWKNYSEFLRDMTKEKPVDPLIENMNENLASIYVAIANEAGVKVTPEAGYRYAMEQNFNAMATRQQYPVNNLLNPFAWAKFIGSVKKGLFKNQKIDRPTPAKVRKKKTRN